MNYTIIFDNGGGITLQIGDWAHWYQNPRYAADDFRTYILTGNTDGWDGYEKEAFDLDPSDDEIRNGGYRVYNDIGSLLADSEETSWGNIQEFAEAYRNLV